MEYLQKLQVQKIYEVLEKPEIDLLASHLAHQLLQYTAWRPDPFSQGTDAVQQNLSQNILYAFPPFSFIKRVSVRDDSRNSNVAHPSMVSSIVRDVNSQTIVIPKQSVLIDSLVDKHPLLVSNTMKLAVWKILGKVWRCQGFQKQLPNLLQELDENHLQQVKNRLGESGMVGVAENKLINFSVL